MGSGNLISIFSKIISLNRTEETIHLSFLPTKISKDIRKGIKEIESERSTFVISTTRQLALEQLRFLN